VREGVARFIAKRDGKDVASYCNIDDIFLTDGASPAVRFNFSFFAHMRKLKDNFFNFLIGATWASVCDSEP
jgi:hypothetical protein